MPNRNDFIDNGTAPEFFVSGLARVELLGPNARFCFYVEHAAGERTLRGINLTFIAPLEAVGPGIEMTVATLGSRLIMPATTYFARRLVS